MLWEQTVRDLDDKVRGTSVVEGISSVGLASISVRRVVCQVHIVAIVLEVSLAGLARSIARLARVRLSTDTDQVADLDVSLRLGSDSNCDTDDFVADDAWEVGWALLMVSM
jgi:hypothetical protein